MKPAQNFLILSNFFSKLMPKHYIGEYSTRPYPRQITQKKLWKIRRQHGKGKQK